MLPSLVSLISPAPPTSLEMKTRERIWKTEKRENKLEGEEEKGKSVHLDGAFGAEVGLENILQALGGIDIHVKCCRFVQHFCIWIQHSQ